MLQADWSKGTDGTLSDADFLTIRVVPQEVSFGIALCIGSHWFDFVDNFIGSKYFLAEKLRSEEATPLMCCILSGAFDAATTLLAAGARLLDAEDLDSTNVNWPQERLIS